MSTVTLKQFKALYPTYTDFKTKVWAPLLALERIDNLPTYLDDTKMYYKPKTIYTFLKAKYGEMVAVNEETNQNTLLMLALQQTLPSLHVKTIQLSNSAIDKLDIEKMLKNIERRFNDDASNKYRTTETSYSNSPGKASGTFDLQNTKDKNITNSKDETIRVKEISNVLEKWAKLGDINLSGVINEFITTFEINSLWEYGDQLDSEIEYIGMTENEILELIENETRDMLEIDPNLADGKYIINKTGPINTVVPYVEGMNTTMSNADLSGIPAHDGNEDQVLGHSHGGGGFQFYKMPQDYGNEIEQLGLILQSIAEIENIYGGLNLPMHVVGNDEMDIEIPYTKLGLTETATQAEINLFGNEFINQLANGQVLYKKASGDDARIDVNGVVIKADDSEGYTQQTYKSKENGILYLINLMAYIDNNNPPSPWVQPNVTTNGKIVIKMKTLNSRPISGTGHIFNVLEVRKTGASATIDLSSYAKKKDAFNAGQDSDTGVSFKILKSFSGVPLIRFNHNDDDNNQSGGEMVISSFGDVVGKIKNEKVRGVVLSQLNTTDPVNSLKEAKLVDMIDASQRMLKRENFTYTTFKQFLLLDTQLKMGGRRVSVKLNTGGGNFQILTGRYEWKDNTPILHGKYNLNLFSQLGTILPVLIELDEQKTFQNWELTTHMIDFDKREITINKEDITSQIEQITVYFDGYEDAKEI